MKASSSWRREADTCKVAQRYSRREVTANTLETSLRALSSERRL